MGIRKAAVIATSLAFAASASLVFAGDLAVKPAAKSLRENKAEIVAEYKTKIADWKEERQQKLEALKLEKEKLRTQFKERMTQERCAKIEARLQNRTAKFGTASGKHTKVYANLLARIDKFIAKFTEFDTANPDKITQANLDELAADRATLATMIETFKTNYSEYISKLGSTQSLTCGSSEGEFRSSLVDSRVYLKNVHDSAAEIRKFVRTEILPDLLAVKKEIAKARGTEGDKEEENGTEEEADETETSDTIAPTVSISNPADGTEYTAATTVTISAAAADNTKVKKVEF
jgi:hypothetical protein